MRPKSEQPLGNSCMFASGGWHRIRHVQEIMTSGEPPPQLKHRDPASPAKLLHGKLLTATEIYLNTYYANNFQLHPQGHHRPSATHTDHIYCVLPNFVRLFSKENCTLLLQCNLSVGK